MWSDEWDLLETEQIGSDDAIYTPILDGLSFWKSEDVCESYF